MAIGSALCHLDDCIQRKSYRQKSEAAGISVSLRYILERKCYLAVHAM